MENSDWVIIDTETTGLADPIYVIEIAAQRMRGWKPVGAPFHAYLNHGVEVPPEATSVNGITTSFLTKYGRAPLSVHRELANYFQTFPIVAHNLSYDWNRCLIPEWKRMSMNAPGTKGFCTMLLSRRVIPETKSVKLDTLRSLFGYGSDGAHSAGGDVATIVSLVGDVFKPRLESAGFKTFDEILRFSRETPIKKCHARLSQCPVDSSQANIADEVGNDSWYFLDYQNNTFGPNSAAYISQLLGAKTCYVWREGMANWVLSSDEPAFIKMASIRDSSKRRYKEDKSIAELVGLCRGIMADGKVTNKEVFQLSNWLEDCSFLDTWPASEIAEEVERILEDGVISNDEKIRLGNLISAIMPE